ncbi:2-keto-4-pentenoate hydratase [Solimonas sp. K1W22B-7]|uniref:2-keto-4-pentenoate hydratase n=1 Tax=Solimonas sp. K1W22B-7 TaxID=2303331 RepID=UPI000E33098F|nr:fumarylacetoacetate hydrolase family protein [Solimonas sp. K1W22B-7]AXQ27930.1 2-keto-4-pentenoate hydratase [Solimonas sp. K1W22B-7]
MNDLSFSPGLQDAAEALWTARARRVPIGQVSVSHGLSGLDSAYAVAAINARRRIAEGARVVGKKVGLTSRSVQQQLGVDQPDFGLLFDDMEFLDGDAVPMSRLIQPKAEAEVAFVVSRDLSGVPPSYSEFLAALAYALPALEIVDSAIADWKLTLVDTVADNASCGLYVLGNQPIGIGQLALGELGLQLDRNGRTESVGSGAACLAHPLRAAYWLARTMAARGEGLRAGEIILSGALGPMVPVTAGDLLMARVGALGSVSCRMV